jgi:hypothetical protein
MSNQNPNPRATNEQRDAVRDEMRVSADKLRKKAAGSLFQTFVEHVQSPDGKVLREFGAMVDGATNGLLSKAIKGMMAPDEPKKDPSITVKEKH